MTAELDVPYGLSAEQIERFRADGFVRLGDVFDEPTLTHYAREISRLIDENNPHRNTPLEQRGIYARAFVQVTNLWTRSAVARELSFSKRLARIATELLGTSGVRMYHDQALFKESGGGVTPWHVDQQYWPMDSAHCVTAWIPLHAVPIEMGPLCFGRGTHLKNIGRDLAISDESERAIRDEVKRQGIIEVAEPFALGDVSFHYGWTVHRAGPNTSGQTRKVHTVIYMDEQMRLKLHLSENQKVDWLAFSPSTIAAEVMDDDLNPVLYANVRSKRGFK
jgi:ectoine hydroxylase-related dioxygenase (phytanoyl-CoA dioxygenase family)